MTMAPARSWILDHSAAMYQTKQQTPRFEMESETSEHDDQQ
jgi:hypothetical protein